MFLKSFFLFVQQEIKEEADKLRQSTAFVNLRFKGEVGGGEDDDDDEFEEVVQAPRKNKRYNKTYHNSKRRPRGKSGT